MFRSQDVSRQPSASHNRFSNAMQESCIGIAADLSCDRGMGALKKESARICRLPRYVSKYVDVGMGGE